MAKLTTSKSKQPSEADVLRSRSSVKLAEYQRVAKRLIGPSLDARGETPTKTDIGVSDRGTITTGDGSGIGVDGKTAKTDVGDEDEEEEEEEPWSEGEDEVGGVGLPRVSSTQHGTSDVPIMGGKYTANEQLRRRLIGPQGRGDRKNRNGNGTEDRHGVSKPMPKSPRCRAAMGEDGDEAESRATLKRRRKESDLKLRSATDLFGSLSTKTEQGWSRSQATVGVETGTPVVGSVDGQATAAPVASTEAQLKKKRPMTYLDEVLAEKEKKRRKKKKKQFARLEEVAEEKG